MKSTRIAAAAGTAALLAAGTFVSGTTAASAATAPTKPVASVDLTRYVGSWYQLAAIPAIYEVQCAGNAKANYAANADGTVAVTNTCKTWFGTTSSVTGKAKVQNAPANSELAVSFFKFFGQQIYTGTNYQIIGLGAAYDWAVVTDPGRSSAFVLSRTPSLTKAQNATVKSILRDNAIDPCRLKVTPQTGGASASGNYC